MNTRHLSFLRVLMLLAVSCCCGITASADSYCDFTVNNIHYIFLSDKPGEVAVSYREFESGRYGGYYSDYTGNVTIPAVVTYNSVSYKVTAVGNGAFAERYNSLTSVSLPNTITSIGNNAFGDCAALQSVSIPQSVKSIGQNAFNGCISLQSVNIPSGVKTIEPSTFYGCRTLSSITIPTGVTSIGERSFYGCTGLRDVTIPEGVKAIGNYAFNGCSNLQDITIPDGVTTIGSYAFSYCSSLSSITMSKDIVSIGTNAFNGTPWLLNQPAGVLYVGKIAYKYIGTMPEGTNITLKDGILEIEASAFYNCTGLESITIPESVTSICLDAFNGCTSLKSITIPKSITSIGPQAFVNCSSLKEVTILCDSIGDGWFYQSNAIERVTFDASLKCIGGSAFYGCEGLTSITIPESVAIINSYAFASCSNLADVTISNSETYVAYKAFDNTPWLDNQPDGLIYMGKVAYLYHGEMPEGTTIEIREGTQEIASSAFADCKNLISISIPGSVKTIGASAFWECSGLTSIILPEGLETIGDYIFAYCTGLTSIAIPKKVKAIGYGTFNGCKNLNKVVLSPNITSIGAYAFQGCQSLDNIVLPNALTKLNSYAFRSCSGLTAVSFGGSLKSIGEYCFAGCSALTKIKLPKSVNSIGGSAFQDCPLTDVTVGFQEPISIYTSVFSYYSNYNSYSYTGLATLHVPAGCKADFEEAAVWGSFKEIIEMEEGTDIPSLENAIYVESLEGFTGKQMTMPIALKNTHQITGLQMDLYLPEGVTVATNSRGKLVVSTTERMDGNYTLTGNVMDGFVRIVGYSADSDAFTGEDGDILNVTLDIAEDLADGDYAIKIKDIVLSDVNSTEYHPADVEATLTVKSYTLGDVDDSGAININDVVCIINYILNRTNGTFIPEAADVDGSGSININDVVTLINRFILHRESAPKRALRLVAEVDETTDHLYLADVCIEPGESLEIAMQLANEHEVKAVQGNIKLPAGLHFVTKSNGRLDVRNLDERSEDFTLSCALQDDGSMTFAHYSADGFAYEGTEGGIFTFKVAADTDAEYGFYDVRLSDVVLSIDGVGYELPALVNQIAIGQATAIVGVEASSVNQACFTLDGRRTTTPQRGVNIVRKADGGMRKMVVK